MSFYSPFRAVPIRLRKRYCARQRKERLRRLAMPVAVVIGAATVGGAIGVLPVLNRNGVLSSQYTLVGGCTVTDGDTIRCGDERIRLLGIDAPEMPGHCREGRDCAPGDPYASTASLRSALVGELYINRVGTDRYGRSIATIKGGKGDLSCWQLASGQAIYKADWDNDLRVARTCPGSIP